MDSDFMNNLANMMKNGNIPQDVKNMMNNFQNANSDNSNAGKSTDNSNDSNNFSGINPEMLSNIMSAFGNKSNTDNSEDSTNNGDTNSNNSDNGFNFNNIDMNMLFKMKSIMDKMNNNKNDPRSNLLLSLKPYLKESRKSKVEQYVQLFNISKVIDALNQDGGENVK